MVISQGEVWWADLGEPIGSGPGYRRPVVVVQCDALNQSRVSTVVCVPLTSNLKWTGAPGNVQLTAKATGLSKDSVANASLIVAIDRHQLTESVGKLPRRQLELVLAGIDTVLGR
ncbi:MAG TPA: type II toxin-antitoxin system PemK/MazF family toxin [Thermoanaerobaculia bacterium]|nr:type II toxin-antitoxin system PemK/MazF family toxin [Thermoanaerobaculia bacterium]